MMTEKDIENMSSMAIKVYIYVSNTFESKLNQLNNSISWDGKKVGGKINATRSKLTMKIKQNIQLGSLTVFNP